MVVNIKLPTEESMAKELSQPKVNAQGQAELDKAEKQFAEFDQEVKDKAGTVPAPRKMDLSKRSDVEMQVPMSQNQIAGFKDIYLKPKKSIGSKEKFNERFREQWEFDRQQVAFIAEHKEVQGESLDLWTKPFPGCNCEEWVVPVNVPVWGPRYLAEQIKRKYYNRLSIDENKQVGTNQAGTMYGQLIVSEQKQRLDCHPVNKGNTSIFMGN
jgi:hypothetical protein